MKKLNKIYEVDKKASYKQHLNYNCKNFQDLADKIDEIIDLVNECEESIIINTLSNKIKSLIEEKKNIESKLHEAKLRLEIYNTRYGKYE